ncbi:sulfatase/phosphatase domain-containing protein [Streptomyces zhihengii]
MENFTDNGPLRGQKGELREGGIRVPLIAWSGNPALVKGGRIDHTPVYAADHHATIASLAGAAPAARPVDGVSLKGLFAGDGAGLGRQAIFWHLPGYLIAGDRDQRPQSVIRSGRWKLVHSYEDRSWELYDLATDIGETRDLAGERPDQVQRLGRDLIRWLDEVDAPLATLREGRSRSGSPSAGPPTPTAGPPCGPGRPSSSGRARRCPGAPDTRRPLTRRGGRRTPRRPPRARRRPPVTRPRTESP